MSRPPPDSFAVVLRAPDRDAASRRPSEADQRSYARYLEQRDLGNSREALQALLTIQPSRNSAGVAVLVAQAQAELGLDAEATANADLAAELASQPPANSKVTRRATEIADKVRPRIAVLHFDLRDVPTGTKVWMDGEPVLDGASPKLDAGSKHQVSAFEGSDQPCRLRSFDVAPGERIEVRIAPEIEILVAR